jgi:hypothetical protein
LAGNQGQHDKQIRIPLKFTLYDFCGIYSNIENLVRWARAGKTGVAVLILVLTGFQFGFIRD